MSRLQVLVIVASIAAGSGGCATTGATPAPFPRPSPPRPATSRPSPGNPDPTTFTAPASASPAAANTVGYGVAGTALSLRGAPYRNGGTDPAGFDCSGFVNYVFGQNGVRVPRTVSEQWRAGHQVTGNLIEPGDLVFFTTVSPGASHVGIAIGGDEFVHAPSGAGEVRVERMSAPYWATRFVGARRVL
jgi:cell wall-associated NlpC family hydrolase